MKTGSTVAPKEALELCESVSLAIEEAASLPEDFFKPVEGSIFDAEGRVPVVVIRPGVGKGRGRHLYTPEMLRENADVFNGWKMYIDHLSPEARKAAGGLPRSVRDLGGRLQETRWIDTLPPTDDFERGGVVGLAKPVPFVRELIENDPEIVESSISAQATAVHPKSHNSERVWAVEGIEPKGSLDWVTEAGAGGRVIPLMEAAYADEEAVDMALLESMDDDEFKTYLEESRPELLEAFKGKKDDDDEDGDADGALKKKCKELEDKGMPPAMALKVARKKLSEAEAEDDQNAEGGDMTDIKPEAIQEALSASPDILLEALQQSSEVQLFVNGLVEAKLEEEREITEQAAQDKVNRVMALHRFRDQAHAAIDEARLPDSWKDSLRAKYTLEESGDPTPALDVLDTVDADGNVTETAVAKLAEAVKDDIKGEALRLAEANPTRVRSQGAQTEDEGGDPKPVSGKDTGWGQFLSESAGVDPDEAYALNGADDRE